MRKEDMRDKHGKSKWGTLRQALLSSHINAKENERKRKNEWTTNEILDMMQSRE